MFLAVLFVFGAAVAARGENGAEPMFDQDFWRHWGDGQSEVSGYELSIPRYGHIRNGTAVAIFVTETFDHDDRVKTDSQGGNKAGGSYPVMKLNLVQDFPTGIYDYNLMASVFVALEAVDENPPGTLIKAVFSSQEWCGQAYQQVERIAGKFRHELRSYFEGEANRTEMLPLEQEGISEDALLLWARGFSGPVLKQGQTKTVPMLRSLQTSRFHHVPVAWDQVTLAHGSGTKQVMVPAGTLEVITYTARILRTQANSSDKRPAMNMAQQVEWVIEVEKAEPHRIIRWTTSEGYKAQMLGSARLKYWQMNGKGFEESVKKIGLVPRGPHMP